MPSLPADLGTGDDATSDRPGLREVLRRSFIKGLAILLPLVVTVLLLSFAFGFVADVLDPLVQALQETPLIGELGDTTILLLTLVVFVLLVVAIGFWSAYGSGDDRLSEQFDEFMGSVPGIGSVYRSFDEMSELLIDSDTDSFQDVKLVEYPTEGSYVVGFKTAETAEVIEESTGNDDMITLFMPMAPNPVMGGFVVHVPRDRVVDVDLTVEEGVRSIVTSGVAVGSGEVEGQQRPDGEPAGGDQSPGDDRPPGGGAIGDDPAGSGQEGAVE